MFEARHRPDEISAEGLSSLPAEVLNVGRPVVLRGAVKGWPFVQAARQSDEAAVDYLDRFYNGHPVNIIVAASSARGRFFYRENSKELNFHQSEEHLSNALKGLLQQREVEQPLGIAMQAVSAPDCLPGIEQENPNSLVPEGTHARVWVGNRVTVAPHFDVVDNIACVVAGRRRFVLFPPQQTANIYPGPIDVTPANVPISMVSLDEPELDLFPRYREAMDAAFVAELDPGDAIYIPYLWWHGVQSLGAFNVLMNYWWSRDRVSAGYPYQALLHLAYVLYRDMPAEHRQAWRALYDHYVFQSGGDPVEALPPGQRYRGHDVDPGKLAKLKDALRDLLSS